MSAEDVKKFYQEYKSKGPQMMQSLPDMAKGFMGMFGSIMKDGALSVKQKELIAMALGVALRCKPCIYLHIQKCVEAGATREEILEAASVVVMMQGGPGFVHIPEVLDTLEALGK
jgi:AhpD family alkylhydroperoxidase